MNGEDGILAALPIDGQAIDGHDNGIWTVRADRVGPPAQDNTRRTLYLRLGESNGGGGGSRTRVRKHVTAKLYMRVRFWVLAPGVRKRRKTAGRQARSLSPPDAEPPSGSQPVWWRLAPNHQARSGQTLTAD